ncbi:MAG: YbgC/FadM family acyl-CoA thioesterase [Deltaproteobacteria bacterium]|nr:YbgC/FadM family acyl-CoA thioesterase [Deltaproteobacteria bacterium]
MYRVRIYYKDTDMGGVVYYGNYLRFFEAARTEFLRDLGADLTRWMKEGITFVVVRAEVDYLASARYDDLLAVETTCAALSGARFDLSYRVVREGDGRLMVTGMTRMAAVGRTGRPVRIPEEVRKALEEAMGDR